VALRPHDSEQGAADPTAERGVCALTFAGERSIQYKEPMESRSTELIEALVMERLSEHDDPDAWRAFMSFILPEAEFLCQGNQRNMTIKTIIGACSRWLRPHQTRWTADGGFASPMGYGRRGFTRYGRPEHDWEISVVWNPDTLKWQKPDARNATKRRPILEFRICVPTRTRRHNQAAVLTTWSPGSPPLPKEELDQRYGFRKINSEWVCTASTGSVSAAYHALAAETMESPANKAEHTER